VGDKARAEVFARFIHGCWGQRVRKILAVADGKGELARKLANKGYDVRIVEDRPRFAGPGHKHIQNQRGWFTAESSVAEDLIVAMHPDEATGEIVLAAVNQHKRFAVVPCCVKGREAAGVRSYDGWLKKLASLCRHRCQQTALHMRGKNIVLYSRSPL